MLLPQKAAAAACKAQGIKMVVSALSKIKS